MKTISDNRFAFGKYVLCPGALLLMVCTSLSAQNQPLVDATLRVLLQQNLPTFSIGSEAELPAQYHPAKGVFYYWSEESYHPVSLESNVPSEAIHYQGPAPFILYERHPSTTEGEPDTYLPRMGCPLPSGAKGTYLLIARMPEENLAAPLRLQPVALDTNTVPAGNVLLFNLGDRHLKVATRNEQRSVAPNRSTLFDITSGTNNQFKVMAAVGTDGDYSLVYRRNWFLSPHSRSLCILYPLNDDMDRWNSRMIPLD